MIECARCSKEAKRFITIGSMEDYEIRFSLCHLCAIESVRDPAQWDATTLKAEVRSFLQWLRLPE